MTAEGKAQCLRACSYKDGIRNLVGNTVDRRTCVAEPVRIGTIENDAKKQSHDSKQYRVYSSEGKATTLCGEGGGLGAKTGLYATPMRQTGGEIKPVYEVIDGKIEIKGKKYPIKLPDGLYIIRKLTPVECERLQTLPDGYTAAVSNTQRYRGLGNGWTAEVIIHILTGAQKDVPRDEEITVLSMYDGIGTGRYCLDKMGFTNVTYYAYEIDGPAMKVALSNYPDIIQLGDAFDLRREDWKLGKRFSKEIATEPIQPERATNEKTDEQGTHASKIKTQSKNPKPAENFCAIDQLVRLLEERRKLSELHSESTRYSLDIRALEYAINVLEVVT